MPTPSMEDYIEKIFLLIKNKGYARVSDIAEALDVHPSSVTKMVQKLDRGNYLVYEKYRGFALTSKGEKIGERLVARHDLLEEFLKLIGVEEENIYEDVEGIEHHLSWNSINRIADLLQYFKVYPERIKEFRALQGVKDHNEDDPYFEFEASNESDQNDEAEIDEEPKSNFTNDHTS